MKGCGNEKKERRPTRRSCSGFNFPILFNSNSFGKFSTNVLIPCMFSIGRPAPPDVVLGDCRIFTWGEPIP